MNSYPNECFPLLKATRLCMGAAAIVNNSSGLHWLNLSDHR